MDEIMKTFLYNSFKSIWKILEITPEFTTMWNTVFCLNIYILFIIEMS